jgi:hypothetical protein
MGISIVFMSDVSFSRVPQEEDTNLRSTSASTKDPKSLAVKRFGGAVRKASKS